MGAQERERSLLTIAVDVGGGQGKCGRNGVQGWSGQISVGAPRAGEHSKGAALDQRAKEKAGLSSARSPH